MVFISYFCGTLLVFYSLSLPAFVCLVLFLLWASVVLPDSVSAMLLIKSVSESFSNRSVSFVSGNWPGNSSLLGDALSFSMASGADETS
jgi:hypothetical protein